MTTVGTGDVWLAQLDPTVGHEQGGRRPVVVVSSEGFHALPINMAVIVPLTGTDRGLLTQPAVASESAGLKKASFARPEDVRSIDATRLHRRLGHVDPNEMDEIRKMLRYFLDL